MAAAAGPGAVLPVLAGLSGASRSAAELEHLLVGTAAAQAADLRAAWARRPWDVLVGDGVGRRAGRGGHRRPVGDADPSAC